MDPLEYGILKILRFSENKIKTATSLFLFFLNNDMGSRRFHELSQELNITTPRFKIKSVPSAQIQVIFTFSGTHQYCRRILRQDLTELESLGQRWSYSRPKQIQFKPQNTEKSKEKMFRTLHRGLIGFRLSISARRNLAEFAVQEAWNILVSSMSRSDNQLNLDIDFNMVHHRIRHEDLVIQELLLGSDCPAMIPSSEACIESLKSMIVDSNLDDSGTRCSICLDDFEGGCEGVCMPCCHIFHGDCIKKWLRTSHYCPLCRFRMPTS